MVFEYMDHTVLEELEGSNRGLSQDRAREFVWQVLRGIEFCHQNNVSEKLMSGRVCLWVCGPNVLRGAKKNINTYSLKK